MASKITGAIVTPNMISVVVNGKAYSVDSTHVNFKMIMQAVKEQDGDKLISLIDIPKAIKIYSSGKVEVRDGEVLYDGEVIHNSLSKRILEHMNAGIPHEAMMKFMENLMLNPSKRAVNELYNFLEHHGLPITEDGHFLAYKRLNKNYTDCHTGKVDNKIGTRVTMNRNKVDDNFGVLCSQGFHVGAMEYVRDFCSHGIIVIVKVNPRDVVSVPQDCSSTKCRVCEYLVLEDYKGDLTAPCYKGDGTACEVVGDFDEDEEWDWDDEDDWGWDDEEDLDDSELEEDDEDEDDEFVPEFLDGDQVHFKSNVHIIYEVDGDSFMDNDGVERVILNGFDALYSVSDLELHGY